jgi:hypothetical protein
VWLELLPNFGDGRNDQAASGCWLTASMPSMNFTPVISFGNWLWPSRRRQLFSAVCARLKTMAIAVLFERHPLDRTVRCRTVANLLSMGVGGPQVLPMLSREVVKRQQRLAVLRQATHPPCRT